MQTLPAVIAIVFALACTLILALAIALVFSRDARYREGLADGQAERDRRVRLAEREASRIAGEELARRLEIERARALHTQQILVQRIEEQEQEREREQLNAFFAGRGKAGRRGA